LFIGYKQQAFLLTLVYKIGKEALICTKMLTLCLVYAIGYRLLGAGFFRLLAIGFWLLAFLGCWLSAFGYWLF
jgi:hypothetical protein